MKLEPMTTAQKTAHLKVSRILDLWLESPEGQQFKKTNSMTYQEIQAIQRQEEHPWLCVDPRTEKQQR